MLQGTRFQVQVLKPYKSVKKKKKTIEEVLDFKAQQLYLSRFKNLFQHEAQQLLDR